MKHAWRSSSLPSLCPSPKAQGPQGARKAASNTVATGATAVVGRVRRAHGLKGELVVLPITDAPDAIFAPGARVFAGTPDGELAADPRTGTPRALTVKATRPFKDGLLAVSYTHLTLPTIY